MVKTPGKDMLSCKFEAQQLLNFSYAVVKAYEIIYLYAMC